MSGLSSLPFRPRLLCVTGLPLTLLGGLAVGVGVLFAATYAVVGSYALSIIILSVGITLLATPLTALAWRSQSARARLLPEIEDLRRRHRDDRQRLAAETAALFKRHHVSPWSGVLPLLPPAFVYLALYQVLRGLIYRPAGSASLLPRYISHSTRLYHALAHGTTMRVWGVDLARNGAAALQISASSAGIFLAMVAVIVIAGVWQRHLTRNAVPRAGDDLPSVIERLSGFLPALFLIWGLVIPLAVTLYYASASVVRLAQYWMLVKWR